MKVFGDRSVPTTEPAARNNVRPARSRHIVCGHTDRPDVIGRHDVFLKGGTLVPRDHLPTQGPGHDVRFTVAVHIPDRQPVRAFDLSIDFVYPKSHRITSLNLRRVSHRFSREDVSHPVKTQIRRIRSVHRVVVAQMARAFWRLRLHTSGRTTPSARPGNRS